MNQRHAYQAFIHAGIAEEKANAIIDALAEPDSESVNKSDLKALELSLKELEIRLIHKMQLQTWTLIGAMGLVSVLSKWLFKI